MFAVAQTTPQSLRIRTSYEKEGHYLEQATETIEAINTVGTGIVVDYEAGHSIVLLPGFQTQTGSVFAANIKPIVSQKEFVLKLQVSPNPFDKSTVITYYLPADGTVNLWITDVQGKIVAQLVKEEDQSSGKHQIEWYPDALEAGVYIPIVEANQQKAASRILKE
ncbi:hypothetical protein GCM10027190_52040 [Spirosoma areae]